MAPIPWCAVIFSHIRDVHAVYTVLDHSVFHFHKTKGIFLNLFAADIFETGKGSVFI